MQLEKKFAWLSKKPSCTACKLNASSFFRQSLSIYYSILNVGHCMIHFKSTDAVFPDQEKSFCEL